MASAAEKPPGPKICTKLQGKHQPGPAVHGLQQLRVQSHHSAPGNDSPAERDTVLPSPLLFLFPQFGLLFCQEIHFKTPKPQIQVVKFNLKANTLPYLGGWFPPSSSGCCYRYAALLPCAPQSKSGGNSQLYSLFPGPFMVSREGLLPLPIKGHGGQVGAGCCG